VTVETLTYAALAERLKISSGADRLITELLKMTADMMEAKETAVKLEGENAALRSLPKPEPMSWWRWLRSTGSSQ
jgi:hypothetical protein